MRGGDIETARLSLIAITPESVGSDLAGDGRLGEITGAMVPEEWPPEHWERHVFELLQGRFAEDAGDVGWHRYVALRGEDGGRTLIGTLGGYRRGGECELGYSLLRGFQGKGYATEGMRAFLERVWEDEAIASVCAQTFPELAGSVRVMEKCGMTLVGAGEEEGTVLYRVGR